MSVVISIPFPEGRTLRTGESFSATIRITHDRDGSPIAGKLIDGPHFHEGEDRIWNEMGECRLCGTMRWPNG